MRYRLISMDFDGTLLTSDKKITERTKETIQKCKDNNYIIVGVTARNLSSVKRVSNLNMFDYLILNNGCYIYDVQNDNGNHIGCISEENAQKITDYFKNIAKEINYCATEKYYTYKNKTSKPIFKTVNNIEEVKEPICRINIFMNSNEDIMKCKNYIDKNFNTVDSIIMQDTDNDSDEKWITLNPKGINKLSTLKNLCQKLNINITEVIFFGDGLNDLELIQSVGLGVAMSNAVSEVKEKAKTITLSNNEEGIAEFLEKI